MEYCLQEINKQTNVTMKITKSADIYEDSGLRDLIHKIQLSNSFKDNDYGNDDIELFFVINCLQFNTKLRKRFDSKDKVLSWDIILDYNTVKNASVADKKKILATSIINSFDILDEYKKLKLDKERIKQDAKKYFMDLGWF